MSPGVETPWPAAPPIPMLKDCLMEAFLGWCKFKTLGACKIPNAVIVPAGVD